MKAEDFGYVLKNNICLFQKGPFSQWYGAWDGQGGGFKILDNCQHDRHSVLHLTPFFNSDISVDYSSGLSFNCCEQWMMANKAILFKDVDTYDRIMNETHPKKQKDLGRKIKNYDEDVWSEWKFNTVYAGNVYKFTYNESEYEFLKSFHPQTIFVEAAPWDKIWGIGLGPHDPKAWDIDTWEGENLLGRAIQKVRMELT